MWLRNDAGRVGSLMKLKFHPAGITRCWYPVGTVGTVPVLLLAFTLYQCWSPTEAWLRLAPFILVRTAGALFIAGMQVRAVHTMTLNEDSSTVAFTSFLGTRVVDVKELQSVGRAGFPEGFITFAWKGGSATCWGKFKGATELCAWIAERNAGFKSGLE